MPLTIINKNFSNCDVLLPGSTVVCLADPLAAGQVAETQHGHPEIGQNAAKPDIRFHLPDIRYTK